MVNARDVRLPVRTALLQNSVSVCVPVIECDYQSERHCSKTFVGLFHKMMCAITSQNGTAPKRRMISYALGMCAITSQNGTAPKLARRLFWITRRAITSQNGTAPKHWLKLPDWSYVRLPVRTALLQNRILIHRPRFAVRLPVRTALLQNSVPVCIPLGMVRLPVRTALLQNIVMSIGAKVVCDYQSERHCSKTTIPQPA